jgi:hypothetical protein
MKLAFATVGISLALTLGCSSGSGGSTSSLDGFAQAYCSALKPCCAQAGLTMDTSLCAALVEAFSQGSTYDPTTGQACLAAVQQESSAPTFCSMVDTGIPACSQVFSSASGTVQGGQPCMQDSDCAKAPGGGAFCFGQFTAADGGSAETQTCVQTMTGKAGDGPCVGTVQGQGTLYSWSAPTPLPAQGFLCANADGLTCDGTTQKCVALSGAGEVCSLDAECLPGDYCAFNTTAGQCAARLADGASCASAEDGCLTTSYCDGGTTTCKPQLATGSACATDQQCASGQCVNQVCGTGDDLGLALYCVSN